MRPLSHLVLLLACTNSSSLPRAENVPTAQTAVQLRAMKTLSAKARAASQVSTNSMTSFLGTAEVRNKLKHYAPQLNSLSAEEIAAQWRSTVAAAEIVHGFHAAFNASRNNALDFDINLALRADWFFTQWQIPILYPERANETYSSLCAFLAPAAANEMNVWDLPPFTAPIPRDPSPTPPLWPGGYPRNLKEASNRAVYAVLNQHRVDFPAYYWGDVAVVFNRSLVDPMVLYTPVDSGDYTCACDATFTTHFCSAWSTKSTYIANWYCKWGDGTTGGCSANTHSNNCSAWKSGTSGVVDAVDHLLLPFATWESDAADRVAAMVGRATQSWSSRTLGNITTKAWVFDWYFEADLLGNVAFPAGVKFVLAEFGANFGSDDGRRVQEWALKWGWPLVWALGPNVLGQDTASPLSWRATGRIIDPVVLALSRAGANLSSIAAHATPAFNATWDAIRLARQTAQWNTTLRRHWWEALMSNAPREFSVEPLMVGSCMNAGNCIAVDVDGNCVCY